MKILLLTILLFALNGVTLSTMDNSKKIKHLTSSRIAKDIMMKNYISNNEEEWEAYLSTNIYVASSTEKAPSKNILNAISSKYGIHACNDIYEFRFSIFDKGNTNKTIKVPYADNTFNKKEIKQIIRYLDSKGIQFSLFSFSNDGAKLGQFNEHLIFVIQGGILIGLSCEQDLTPQGSHPQLPETLNLSNISSRFESFFNECMKEYPIKKQKYLQAQEDLKKSETEKLENWKTIGAVIGVIFGIGIIVFIYKVVKAYPSVSSSKSISSHIDQDNYTKYQKSLHDNLWNGM